MLPGINSAFSALCLQANDFQRLVHHCLAVGAAHNTTVDFLGSLLWRNTHEVLALSSLSLIIAQTIQTGGVITSIQFHNSACLCWEVYL